MAVSKILTITSSFFNRFHLGILHGWVAFFSVFNMFKLKVTKDIILILNHIKKAEKQLRVNFISHNVYFDNYEILCLYEFWIETILI